MNQPPSSGLPRPLFFASALSLLLLAPSAQSAARGDETARILEERANRPAEPAAARPEGVVGAGNQLFYMDGPDNAPVVRGLADVTGDGVDEVLLGIDESGTYNVFCLDGTSAGNATVVWQVETSDGVSGGSPYGDQCMVASSDVDGNGYPNLLLGTAWGGRTAYNLDGQAGATRWKFDTYLTANSGWVYSLCEINDVNGDGVPEAAFGTGSFNDRIYLVDGASVGGQATIRWAYEPGDATYTVRSIGDVNGDGDFDVLAAVGDNVDRILCLDGGTENPAGNLLWSHNPGTSVYTCGVIADVTGDGIADALAGLWTLGGNSVRCLDGTDGTLVWASTQVNDYCQTVETLEDVTGDGLSEVIVGSWANAVIVLDGSDGSQVWRTNVGTTNGGDVWTARAIDDLNGDGRQDVIAGSFDYHVYAMDGDTGEVFWAYDTGNRIYSVHAVGDLNGDGRPEVAVGTQDTSNARVFHVLEGDAGIPFPGLTMAGEGLLGTQLSVEITGPAGSIALPAYSESLTSVVVPGLSGMLQLGSPIKFLPSGIVPASGAYVLSGTIPNEPALIGRTIYNQGAAYTVGPLNGAFTDVEELTFSADG